MRSGSRHNRRIGDRSRLLQKRTHGHQARLPSLQDPAARAQQAGRRLRPLSAVQGPGLGGPRAGSSRAAAPAAAAAANGRRLPRRRRRCRGWNAPRLRSRGVRRPPPPRPQSRGVLPRCRRSLARRKKVARFITAEAAQSTLRPAADGKLPDLQLEEGAAQQKPQAGQQSMNPWSCWASSAQASWSPSCWWWRASTGRTPRQASGRTKRGK